MKIISKETSKRVCYHMNNDHIDSVHKYLIHYGKISRFENAYMEEINNSYIKINYDGHQSVIINFKNEISEEEIHSTLVSMIREIKEKIFFIRKIYFLFS
jgi:putative heme iron utilization protein